jgi:hypothetical protein
MQASEELNVIKEKIYFLYEVSNVYKKNLTERLATDVLHCF